MNKDIPTCFPPEVKHYALTEHLESVRHFMMEAKQTTSFAVRCPTPEERILRAKLIYEEAMETIEALGVDHILGKFVDAGEKNYNPVAVLDGACDIAVVTNGTLIACGLDGAFPEALKRVDQNNLSKFGEGSYLREDGKVMKPPNYKPVYLDDLVDYTKEYDGDSY